MSNIRKALVFYAITLALAVLVRLAVPWIGEASLLLTMLTPALGVLAMLLVIAPEGGLRDAFSSLGLNKAGWKAWPFAIAGPLLIHVIGIGVLVATGLTALLAPTLPAVPLLAVLDLLIGFLISTVLALGEEVGWRGYMQPRLLSLGPVYAMLLVGFLHGLWHMPILLTTDLYHSTGNPWLVAPLFLITLTLAGVFYGFLRQWTASVWPVAVAHAAANTAWNLATRVSETKSPMVLEYVGGESGVIVIVGLLLINWAIIAHMRKNPHLMGKTESP